ncbi:unnamed protein product [Polarella glacialis]|nr:unnamed protein product [Polarella glacialis]
MSLKSGAEQVVAFEASAAHAAAARRRLERLFGDTTGRRVQVLTGKSTDMEETALMPFGTKPDLLVAELLGYTASEEGAPAVFADLQRRLGPLPAVPSAAQSLAVPVAPLVLSRTDVWRNWWVHGGWLSRGQFPPGPALYDCRNFPRELELAEPQVWEEFNFSNLDQLEAQLQQDRELVFNLPAGTEVGGLLLWMRAELADGIYIDTRKECTSWNQYYLHLGPQVIGPDGRLGVSAKVDARTEDVSYEFQVGQKSYRSHP